MTMNSEKMSAREAVHSAAKSAMVFLLPAHQSETGRADEQSQAGALVELAIKHCVRGGRLDLAFKLQEIGLDLQWGATPDPR